MPYPMETKNSKGDSDYCLKALDAGEDLEAKLAAQKQLAESTGDAEQAWKAEVWDKMLQRIRKMESMLNSSDQP